MNIRKITLHRLKMKLKHPFRNSLSAVSEKEFSIVEVENGSGLSGYGETVAFDAPWYTEETNETTQYMLEQFLVPLLKAAPISHPSEVQQRFQAVKGNPMAKAALEEAVWDLYAKEQNLPLHRILGGVSKEIAAGISIGIENTVESLLAKIEDKISEGYKRVKIKIKPGWDVNVLREIRSAFPSLPLMADANSAYSLRDLDHLKQLDEFSLLMIEQPFAHNDFADHAVLQEQLATPVCLDESIQSLADARTAIALGSCRIINLKIGRVGGLQEAIDIHNLALEHGIGLWCGGMLESGIGRAHNMALASLPGFTLPGDIGSSSHYWHEDIIVPEVIVEKGIIKLNDLPGIGYRLNQEVFEACRTGKKTFSL